MDSFLGLYKFRALLQCIYSPGTASFILELLHVSVLITAHQDNFFKGLFSVCTSISNYNEALA